MQSVSGCFEWIYGFIMYAVGWPINIDFSESDVYGLREIIVIAAYVIGGTVGLVLIIAIILTAIQRALLMRQARNQACRDNGSRRQLVREQDSSRGQQHTAAAADLPPPYDVVMGSPDQRTARTTANVLRSGSGSAASPAIASQTSQLLTNDDVIRPPSYDDALHQNTSAK